MFKLITVPAGSRMFIDFAIKRLSRGRGTGRAVVTARVHEGWMAAGRGDEFMGFFCRDKIAIIIITITVICYYYDYYKLL